LGSAIKGAATRLPCALLQPRCRLNWAAPSRALQHNLQCHRARPLRVSIGQRHQGRCNLPSQQEVIVDSDKSQLGSAIKGAATLCQLRVGQGHTCLNWAAPSRALQLAEWRQVETGFEVVSIGQRHQGRCNDHQGIDGHVHLESQLGSAIKGAATPRLLAGPSRSTRLNWAAPSRALQRSNDQQRHRARAVSIGQRHQGRCNVCPETMKPAR